MIVYDEAKGPDRSAVSIWKGGNMQFVWELQPAEWDSAEVMGQGAVVESPK